MLYGIVFYLAGLKKADICIVILKTIFYLKKTNTY